LGKAAMRGPVESLGAAGETRALKASTKETHLQR